MEKIELSLNSDTFKEFKNDFDMVLKRTIRNMEDEHVMNAALSVKLIINLNEDSAPDFDALHSGAQREIIVPKFLHEIKSVLKKEITRSGGTNGYYELVWDEESGDYTMRPVDNGQQSF